MDLDDILDIDDFEPATLQAMVERLKRSHAEEHFIYREAELDQIWRLLDMAIAADERAKGRPAAELRALRDAVHAAHDLVGMDGRPLAAAGALEAAIGRTA